MTEIYILLAEEVAPRIINRPIVPAAVAIAAPPTVDPDAIGKETRMKEAAMKAYKAGTEADEARAEADQAGAEPWAEADQAGAEPWAEADETTAEAWVKAAAKGGVEAPEPAAMKAAAEPAAKPAAMKAAAEPAARIIAAAAGVVEEMSVADIVSAVNAAIIDLEIELRIFHLRDRLHLNRRRNKSPPRIETRATVNTCGHRFLQAHFDQR